VSIVDNTDRNLDLEDQAREWYLRLQEDPANDGLREDFLAWYETDERHRRTYEEVASFWLDIEEMADEEMADHVTNDAPPVSASVTSLAGRRKRVPPRGKFLSGNLARIAAGIVILLAVGFSWYGYSSYLPEGTYRTDVGEQTRILLADGSRVFMNTDSLLREEYTAGLRKVVLLRGEAIFDVEKDPARPFVVETNYGAVRAVGTEFSVYDRDDKAEVIVIEGTVAMHRGPDLREMVRSSGTIPEKDDLYVSGGQKIFVYDDHFGAVGQASQLDLDRLYFSRQGKVIFRGQPLSEIVREMARYTNKKIIITDRAVKQMKMGGAFDIDDFEAFINAVEDAFPVKVIRVTPFVTFITEA
jgi:transmembrane sensor